MTKRPRCRPNSAHQGWASKTQISGSQTRFLGQILHEHGRRWGVSRRRSDFADAARFASRIGTKSPRLCAEQNPAGPGVAIDLNCFGLRKQVVEGAETGPPCVQDFDDDGEYIIKMEILTPREVATSDPPCLFSRPLLCIPCRRSMLPPPRALDHLLGSPPHRKNPLTFAYKRRAGHPGSRKSVDRCDTVPGYVFLQQAPFHPVFFCIILA